MREKNKKRFDKVYNDFSINNPEKGYYSKDLQDLFDFSDWIRELSDIHLLDYMGIDMIVTMSSRNRWSKIVREIFNRGVDLSIERVRR